MKSEDLFRADAHLQQQIERLKSGEYWATYYWHKDRPSVLGQFRRKYGFEPTRIAIGKKVDLQVPDGMILWEIDIPDEQVWLQ